MKRIVRFFVSYARRNKRRADEFLERLEEQLRPSKQYDYRLWRDTGILPGEDWDREIHAALDESDLGLVLVTPTLLTRDYVLREELPKYVGHEAKPVIPVLLEPVDLARHDLHGLEAHQLFSLDGPRGPLAYADCRDDRTRRRFAEELFRQIERRLDKLP